jgi:hypothetical protein
MRTITRALRALAGHAPETLSVAGLATISWGGYLIARPAGVILAGVTLLLCGIAATR